MKEQAEKLAGAPGPEDLALIGKYARRELSPEEVYIFPVVLCDNEVDRDGERFSIPALEKLAELFLGRTGIFDHDPKGRNQTARIYRCRVERDPDRRTRAGEVYCALRADAYMVRSPENQGLILEIDGGIKKEVSVGCACAAARCSICGADRRQSPCGHRPGEEYGGVLCHTVLEDPTDAYEWSFVAVPAQPAAGVVKGRSALPGEPVEWVAKALEAGEGLALSPAEARELARWAGGLEKLAREGRLLRERRLEETLRLGLLAHPGLERALLKKALEGLDPLELEEWEAALRKAAARRLPVGERPLVQTAPEESPREGEAGPQSNRQFMV